jgi:hydrogenase nickel incorporation protein HypB
MAVEQVKVVKNILTGNDQVAEKNRRRLDDAGVFAVNVMASPGSGKTSLITQTIAALGPRLRIGVIEGDIAGSIDTETVLAAGAADAVQINTGGGCHLEANMVGAALDNFDLAQLDLLFVENVGNLVCPTHWSLGEHLRLCLLSTPEGHDKPLKYPALFESSDVIVVNKIDLLQWVDFDRAQFRAWVRALNPTAPILELSCRTGEGVPEWADWLAGRVGG